MIWITEGSNRLRFALNDRTIRRQRGAATLLLVLGLVLLATLASAYSSRAVLMDLLTSQGRGRSLQARHTAHAALASAEAELLQPDATAPQRSPFADAAMTTACSGIPGDLIGPSHLNGLTGPQWQCSTLRLSQATTPDGWALSALLARDLVESPHVWQIHASARHTQGPGQARVSESVFAPVLAPAPADTPTAALILNGCASEAPGSTWRLCPPSRSANACSGTATGPVVYSHNVTDTNKNGSISSAERKSCMAFAASSLPAGGSLASPASPNPTSKTACNRAAWRSALGETTPEQVRAWSQAQERNGLSAQSQPPRSVWWIDSPADWTQSLGSPDQPVLLVFSAQACAQRCPRIAAGVHIHGTVYADAGCDDDKMRGWQAGWVEGQVIVEAGLPQVSGSSQLWARAMGRNAYILEWPDGIDPRPVQRVPGSRWSLTP